MTTNQRPVDTESHTFAMEMECHYCLRVPAVTPDALFLVLHGYGMNASTMLELSQLVLGKESLIASIQAPHHFYLSQNEPNPKVGYSWGTRNHGTASIRFHHAMIRKVRNALEHRFHVPPKRTILLGFSQPVGYNYRFAATYPNEVGGVIGICGGVPKDFETGDYQSVSASLLHIARDQDEVFPTEITTDYERKLRTRATDVEFHLLPGGHRFPSKGRAVIEPWLNRLGIELPRSV